MDEWRMKCTWTTAMFILTFGVNCVNAQFGVLGSPCSSSAQCAGVALCFGGMCQCPPAHIAMGFSCVPVPPSPLAALLPPPPPAPPLAAPPIPVLPAAARIAPGLPFLPLAEFFGLAPLPPVFPPPPPPPRPVPLPPAAVMAFPGSPCASSKSCLANAICLGNTCACPSGFAFVGGACAQEFPAPLPPPPPPPPAPPLPPPVLSAPDLLALRALVASPPLPPPPPPPAPFALPFVRPSPHFAIVQTAPMAASVPFVPASVGFALLPARPLPPPPPPAPPVLPPPPASFPVVEFKFMEPVVAPPPPPPPFPAPAPVPFSIVEVSHCPRGMVLVGSDCIPEAFAIAATVGGPIPVLPRPPAPPIAPLAAPVIQAKIVAAPGPVPPGAPCQTSAQCGPTAYCHYGVCACKPAYSAYGTVCVLRRRAKDDNSGRAARSNSGNSGITNQASDNKRKN